MSPALMYSFARATIASNSSGVVFETGGSILIAVEVDAVVEGQGTLKSERDLFDARKPALIGRLRGDARPRAYGRNEGDLVPDPIEDHHHGRADHDRVRNSEGVRVRIRQALHLAHHVVAEITEETGSHRRHVVAERQGALGDQRAKAFERRALIRHEVSRLVERAAIDRRDAVLAPPDEIGVEPDHRETPADGAALDGFEKEGRPRRPCRNLRKAATGVSRSPTSVVRRTAASPDE